MGADTPNPWITLFVAVVSGGGLKYVYDSFKDYRQAEPIEIRRQSVVDASIVTVSRARDELEEDNARLRQTHAEDRANWAVERDRMDRDRAAWALERSAWDSERASLRSEIDALRVQIQKERKESTERYDRLLDRLADLSARHAQMPNEGAV